MYSLEPNIIGMGGGSLLNSTKTLILIEISIKYWNNIEDKTTLDLVNMFDW